MKKTVWVKSLLVCLLVLALMAGGAVLFVTAETVTPYQGIPTMVATEEISVRKDLSFGREGEEENKVEQRLAVQEVEVIKNIVPEVEKPREISIEEVVNLPAVNYEGAAVVVETAAVQTAEAVSYIWGSNREYTLRTEVRVSNDGTETARYVRVAVPLLENNSPYQSTTLKWVNYEIAATSGRVSTFELGEIAPGESKNIIIDFKISVNSFSIAAANDTIEKVRTIYEQFAGPGNCRELARAFIGKCREENIKAREVIGYAYPQRGAMTPGTLQGSRHSWAEFFVEGFGWVPVDLTFQYFGSFPHTSHIIESYEDHSLKVEFTGGAIDAAWSNTILK